MRKVDSITVTAKWFAKEKYASPLRRMLRRCEAKARKEEPSGRDEGRIQPKTTLGFVSAKKPSSRQRKMGWISKLGVLSPSLAHFPMHINSNLLDLFRVRILRGKTLLRVSPFFFLNHHFLGFEILFISTLDLV